MAKRDSLKDTLMRKEIILETFKELGYEVSPSALAPSYDDEAYVAEKDDIMFIYIIYHDGVDETHYRVDIAENLYLEEETYGATFREEEVEFFEKRMSISGFSPYGDGIIFQTMALANDTTLHATVDVENEEKLQKCFKELEEALVKKLIG